MVHKEKENCGMAPRPQRSSPRLLLFLLLSRASPSRHPPSPARSTHRTRATAGTGRMHHGRHQIQPAPLLRRKRAVDLPSLCSSVRASPQECVVVFAATGTLPMGSQTRRAGGGGTVVKADVGHMLLSTAACPMKARVPASGVVYSGGEEVTRFRGGAPAGVRAVDSLRL